ncbi:MAG TPA: tetratricopeptide repeat protein [Gemmataceae bacterium]|nr:tetratricopeptide repeat protein [Gemmataceae bacterium]
MPSMSQTLAQARADHQAGRLEQAERTYRSILQVDPNHAEALHLLGLMAYQLGKLDAADQFIGRAIQLNNNEPSFFSNLGLVYQAQGRLDEAAASFHQAVRLGPRFAGAHSNLGTVLSQQGRLKEATEAFRQAVQLEPEKSLFHFNLGNTLLKQGQHREAVRCYRLALERRRDYPEAYNNLGSAFLYLDELAEAEQNFREALRLRPRFADACNNLGLTCMRQGRLEEARQAFEQAVLAQPDFVQAHHNLGKTFFELRRLEEALQHYQRALRLQADFAEAHQSMGHLLWKVGRTDEAISAYREALRLKPSFADGHCGLGLALMEQGRLVEAQEAFRQALRLQPDFATAHSNLLLALTYDPDVEPRVRFAEHCHWGARHGHTSHVLPPPSNDRDSHRRLRIGYVSPDFRTHVVSRFIAPILRHHDRSQFQVYCYAEVRGADVTTGKMREWADVWRSTCGRNDSQIAEMIRGDGIDILIELAGHTGGNRLGAFAYRPAPVQVTYLGYPNTTGLTAIQYRLTDAIADPPGESGGHTEELVRLDGSFCCWEPPEDVPEVAPRKTKGTPLVFGSLHNPAKLNDRVLELWARILQAIPDSRLLLFRHSMTGSTRERIRRRLTERGVDDSRIDCRNALLTSASSHLSIYEEIDVLLDTFPWGGHATACEALWMGVPVLTLRGSTHAGRLATSILTAVGLTEWISSTVDGYLSLAVERTKDRAQLSVLRSGLRSRMGKSRLCDGKAFTLSLEMTCRQLWRDWCLRESAYHRGMSLEPR